VWNRIVWLPNQQLSQQLRQSPRDAFPVRDKGATGKFELRGFIRRLPHGMDRSQGRKMEAVDPPAVAQAVVLNLGMTTPDMRIDAKFEL
jgi:hypothetical protein